LLGADSVIAGSGVFFDLNVLDENASAHVALGKGHPGSFVAGGSMAPRQLAALGCNQSGVHADVMFGSAEMTIVATRSREGEVVLIEQGNWTHLPSSSVAIGAVPTPTPTVAGR
jgi:aminopeptidase